MRKFITFVSLAVTTMLTKADDYIVYDYVDNSYSDSYTDSYYDSGSYYIEEVPSSYYSSSSANNVVDEGYTTSYVDYDSSYTYYDPGHSYYSSGYSYYEP